jgi:CubicO group peptidase (beta-lactamase class C family)
MPSFDNAVDLLAAFVTKQMRSDATPGLALAVTDRKKLLHVATFGHADVAAQSSVTPETLFEIGSIGKSFAAIVLLQLQEEGRIDVNAPVTDYIPWFKVRSAFTPITLHHLLSHTAGITCGVDFSPEAIYQIWSLRETDATAPPGTSFHYSNLGYKILGHVVERVTGKRFPDVVQTRIYDPLGMDSAVPEITHALRPRLAVGYAPLFDDRPRLPRHPLVPATWLEGETADGSLVMTAPDLATYHRMLLNRGAYPGGRLLSSRSFDLLTQRIIEVAGGPEPRYYGYGLRSYDDSGHTYFGHGGGMIGYFAGMLGDLDAGLGAVVLVNGPGSPNLLARHVVDLLCAAVDGTEPPDLPSPTTADAIQNADDFAGTFRSRDRSLTVRAGSGRLSLEHEGTEIPLIPYGTGAFLADHPAFDRYALVFGRNGDRVVELFHGPGWLVNDRYDGPAAFDHPPEWLAFPGRYRSHNPWLPFFAVVLRKGELCQIVPAGADGFDAEQPLIPLPDGSFRVGSDERGPERIRFDTIVDGQAVRANLSGGEYYYAGTP